MPTVRTLIGKIKTIFHKTICVSVCMYICMCTYIIIYNIYISFSYMLENKQEEYTNNYNITKQIGWSGSRDVSSSILFHLILPFLAILTILQT